MPKTSYKRENFLPWDDYFMGVALLSAHRSKDPNTQVGACIVNPDKKVLGTGYNGLANGHRDDDFNWKVVDNFLETKHTYICHAELNAIVNSGLTNLVGCTLYSTLFPCHECAKLIVQTGIRKIYYISEKYSRPESITAAKDIFKITMVDTIRLVPSVSSLNLSFLEETGA